MTPEKPPRYAEATTLIGEVPIQDTDLTVDHIEVGRPWRKRRSK